MDSPSLESGSTRRAIRFGAAWLLVGLLLGLVGPALADMPVPIKLQGVLLKKALTYDKALASSDELEILVVYGPESAEDHDAVVATFKALALSSRAVDFAEIEPSLGEGSVIYVMPGAGSVRHFSRDRGVLTMSGVPELVRSGEVVLAIGLEGSSPRIFINQTELNNSGHEFSSKLLQLANLVD